MSNTKKYDDFFILRCLLDGVSATQIFLLYGVSRSRIKRMKAIIAFIKEYQKRSE